MSFNLHAYGAMGGPAEDRLMTNDRHCFVLHWIEMRFTTPLAYRTYHRRYSDYCLLKYGIGDYDGNRGICNKRIFYPPVNTFALTVFQCYTANLMGAM